jgi:Ca2+-transporting ATPase
MVYAGTAVSYGRGRAVVTGTGMATEFGKVARMLESVKAGQTPLQENLDKVGKALTRAALVIVSLIVGVGLLRGQDFVEMLIFGVALAVAVVPEALPAVVTISLAVGVQRMVRKNALVRRLTAVETLGSTTIICSDKTGTLTKDEMTVRKVYAGGRMYEVSGAGYEPVGKFSCDGAEVEPAGVLSQLLEAGALASDTHIAVNKETGRWQVQGDPTEGALVVAAAKAGLDKRRVGEIPFTSESKRMTTAHSVENGKRAHSKGAPEVVLESCTQLQTDDGEQALDADGRAAILNTAQRMADEA